MNWRTLLTYWAIYEAVAFYYDRYYLPEHGGGPTIPSLLNMVVPE
jgi:hypothetical protein